MFEKYLDIPNDGRDKKNRELLDSYQSDINELSNIFTESQLFTLLTEQGDSGEIRMKVIPDIIDILGLSLNTSKHINFFQHVPLLKKWLSLQSEEYSLLSIKIYAPESPRQNKIPKEIKGRIEGFIEGFINNPKAYPKIPMARFLKTLEHLCEPEFHYASMFFYIPSEKLYNTFLRLICIYSKRLARQLKSKKWLTSIPTLGKLSPKEVSLLIFSVFLSEYYFRFIQTTLKNIESKGVIDNDYLSYTSMIDFILLALLPYSIMMPEIENDKYKFSLTPPDDFIIKNLINFKKQNLTGYKKDTAQLMNKTYLYIALLINPKWAPSSKDIIRFLEGDHKTIHGCFQTWGSKVSQASQINNITALRKEDYFINFMERMFSERQ